ncbi:hypothetical protein HZS_1755, partial [Henneguya salminicola]
FRASRGWVDNFIKFCGKLRQDFKLLPEFIGNMDETAIRADMPSNSSFDHRGVKNVPILKTGHDKSRGTLPPLIVFLGKRIPIDLKNIRGAHVSFTANGWMLPETTEMWIKNIWRTFSFQRRLLVWEAFRCHLTSGIKKKLKSTNNLMACIPGGLPMFRGMRLLMPNIGSFMIFGYRKMNERRIKHRH